MWVRLIDILCLVVLCHSAGSAQAQLDIDRWAAERAGKIVQEIPLSEVKEKLRQQVEDNFKASGYKGDFTLLAVGDFGDAPPSETYEMRLDGKRFVVPKNWVIRAKKSLSRDPDALPVPGYEAPQPIVILFYIDFVTQQVRGFTPANGACLLELDSCRELGVLKIFTTDQLSHSAADMLSELYRWSDKEGYDVINYGFDLYGRLQNLIEHAPLYGKIGDEVIQFNECIIARQGGFFTEETCFARHATYWGKIRYQYEYNGIHLAFWKQYHAKIRSLLDARFPDFDGTPTPPSDHQLPHVNIDTIDTWEPDMSGEIIEMAIAKSDGAVSLWDENDAELVDVYGEFRIPRKWLSSTVVDTRKRLKEEIRLKYSIDPETLTINPILENKKNESETEEFFVGYLKISNNNQYFTYPRRIEILKQNSVDRERYLTPLRRDIFRTVEYGYGLYVIPAAPLAPVSSVVHLMGMNARHTMSNFQCFYRGYQYWKFGPRACIRIDSPYSEKIKISYSLPTEYMSRWNDFHAQITKLIEYFATQ